MESALIRIPATSANIGPGYDCLGVALKLYNQITVSKGRKTTAHPMVDQAADLFFLTTALRPFRFTWSVSGDVPISRGLGSSVTLRLGILHGLNQLSGAPLHRRQLFNLCSALEGHPDNAAPAEFGGFTVAGSSGAVLRFPVRPALKFVLLIPDHEVLTADARRVLPTAISHNDAVRTVGNACTLAAAFASGRYADLRGAFGDWLHQPHRTPLLPELPAVIDAGVAAGALGGFLSGSGSTIACVTLRNPDKVAAAMMEAFGGDPTAITTTADNGGTRVIRT